MPDLKTYEERRRAQVRKYAKVFNTEGGKDFIKDEMMKYIGTEVDAETDFKRGVQEGQRRLAKAILDLANYERNDNE